MKATKKLIGAAVALVAAASLTVGSTFAWFTSRQNVNLDAVDFNVTSQSENLMMAVLGESESVTDSTAFSYVLDENTIKAKINGGTAVFYDHVTSADGKALKKKDGSTAADAGTYASFKIVFRYFGEITSGLGLVLDSTSSILPTEDSYTPSNPVYAWKDITTADYGGTAVSKGGVIVTRAAYAARVSFEDTSDNAAKIWAPHEKLGDSMTANDTSDSTAGYYEGNLASDYNVYAISATAVTPVDLTGIRVYAAKDANTTKTNNIIKAFPAKSGSNAYSELTMVVRVWLEGTDGDCFNSCLADSFEFKLSFRAGTAS